MDRFSHTKQCVDRAMFKRLLFRCLIVLALGIYLALGIIESSPNWEELISTDGVKYTGRNAHASTVFKDELWVTGGRTASYIMYNLLDSFKVGDVWHSKDGAIWQQESEMTGDYFAQNTDVPQPGPITPWYQRYGHSLDAIDLNNDTETDLMVLLGGYASSPSNDQWASQDGKEWVFCGHAPWSPRAWHGTTVFKGKLYLMGGTPLNNEVWMLENVTRISDRRPPLTRAMYSNYSYQFNWLQLPNAPWSPRVGMGVVSQFYFNRSNGEELAQSRERMVLIGGYGGFPNVGSTSSLFDGYVSRADTWHTYDGLVWEQLNWNNSFGSRAWMGAAVLFKDSDPKVEFPVLNRRVQPPRIYVFGGGFIGFRTNSKKRVNEMQAKADGYWSYDAQNWVKINYEEGGGTTSVPYFSSQEWAETIVDTNTEYLGRWGLTLHKLERTGQPRLYLIAGDFSGGGEFANSVYRNLDGLYCDVNGVICFDRGLCKVGTKVLGCECDPGYDGFLCEVDETSELGAAAFSSKQKAQSALIVGATLWFGIISWQRFYV